MEEKWATVCCKQCGEFNEYPYKTRQPEFCSQKCRNRYNYLKRKKKTPPPAHLRQIIAATRRWVNEGLAPCVGQLVDITKKYGLDCALDCAKAAKIALDIPDRNKRNTEGITEDKMQLIIDFAIERYGQED